MPDEFSRQATTGENSVAHTKPTRVYVDEQWRRTKDRPLLQPAPVVFSPPSLDKNNYSKQTRTLSA